MTSSINVLLQPAINAALVASTALITALGGTAVYYNSTPQTQDLPYVIYSFSSGGPENSSPWERWTKEFEIRCYADNAGSVDTLDSLCSEAITETEIIVTGYCSFQIERTADAPGYSQIAPDNQEVHSGGAFYTIGLSENNS